MRWCVFTLKLQSVNRNDVWYLGVTLTLIQGTTFTISLFTEHFLEGWHPFPKDLECADEDVFSITWRWSCCWFFHLAKVRFLQVKHGSNMEVLVGSIFWTIIISREIKTGWWFQHVWNILYILYSQIGSSPKVGVKIEMCVGTTT